jgi:hypothetical protein
MTINTSQVELISIPLIDEVFEHVGQAYIYEKDNRFVLAWNDGLVNEWSESFDSLGVAMARLSVLHYAVGAGKFFTNDPHEFAADAGNFLKGQIEEMK